MYRLTTEDAWAEQAESRRPRLLLTEAEAEAARKRAREANQETQRILDAATGRLEQLRR